MNLSELNTATLQNLIKLTEHREALLKEIEKIDKAVNAAFEGKNKPSNLSGSARAKRKVGRAGTKGGKSGKFKRKILEALQESGSPGITVKELAERIGVKINKLRIWFYTTGKKLGAIEKNGVSRYRLKAHESLSLR